MSDNFHFDVSSKGRTHFSAVFGLVFSEFRTATHFKIMKPDPPQEGDRPDRPSVWNERRLHTRLIFAWSESSHYDPLPYPMNRDAAEEFAWHWLETADYGREPDHDGSNGKGWRIFNEAWGHVAGNHYAFIAVEPEWMLYGK